MNIFDLIDSSPYASFFIAWVVCHSVGVTIVYSARAFASIFTKNIEEEDDE